MSALSPTDAVFFFDFLEESAAGDFLLCLVDDPPPPGTNLSGAFRFLFNLARGVVGADGFVFFLFF